MPGPNRHTFYSRHFWADHVSPSNILGMAVISACSIAGWVLAGGPGLILAAVASALGHMYIQTQRRPLGPPLSDRETLLDWLDRAIRTSARKSHATGALMVEIDQFKQLEERHDMRTVDHIVRTTSDRLLEVLRDTDMAAQLGGPAFAVALSPVRRLDLEAAIQLSTRIQHALSEPIPLNGMNAYITVSIGFCLGNRISMPTGASLLQAATSALIEAQRYSPGAVRSYSKAMHNRIIGRGELAGQVSGAIERGEICAYFQPQISTRTGSITGFETLARWEHPIRGLIPPIEFLPALEEAGMMDQLGALMVREALSTLRRWDDKGLNVPQIGVNFSPEELRDPRLADRIASELKRFSFHPERLVVEVLETVVANHAEDIVLRNLSALSDLGCKLDLDDFGTGHASITSIRRFSIERIKIDRSFVTKIDADPEQLKMVAAILTMAERLGLDTLAEGVETPEERATLGELGCGHIQGFGISRPMPGEETDRWIADYRGQNASLIPFRKAAN